MRRWFAAPVVLIAAIGLSSLSAPRAAAQPPAPEEESFLTADGVQLKGVFHATDKGGAAPVVILMYPPGPDRDMTKGDWVGLAKVLNEKGYHVFRFDWRGHGKSTEIKDPKRFWENPYLNAAGAPGFNGYIKGAGKKPLKNDLSYKDLTKADRYFPAYLNDLAAVRLHLDTKNDNKTVNTSSIYLIGAGDAATLGMAWLAAEWQRPAVFPPPGLLGVNVPGYEFVPQRLTGTFPAEGGQDVSGAVWLSPSRPASVPEATVKQLITLAPKIRENNPMLFLYADKDGAGKKNSEFFFNEVLIANPRKALMLNPLDQTFIKEVKGGEQLSGVKLLGNGTPKVEETIVQFLAAIQKERAKTPSKARNYNSPYFIDVRSYGFKP